MPHPHSVYKIEECDYGRLLNMLNREMFICPASASIFTEGSTYIHVRDNITWSGITMIMIILLNIKVTDYYYHDSTNLERK